jgi:hypothetical protein
MINATSPFDNTAGTAPALTELSFPNDEAEAAAFFAAHDGRWPYSENSGLIDRETAFGIRVLMLQWMCEAELNTYSQRQLLAMYVDFLECLLEDVCPEMTGPEVKKWAQERAKYALGLDQQEPHSGSSLAHRNFSRAMRNRRMRHWS